MKIIQHNTPTEYHQHIVDRLCKSSVFPISEKVVAKVHQMLQPGPTMVLFSGGWRLNIDATYLEVDGFKSVAVAQTKKKTYFVDINNTKLLLKILNDSRTKNILFLHSGMFCNYKHIAELITSMDQWAINDAQVILSVPTIRTDFNRLKYSCADIARQYSAEYIEDSFIIKRNRQLSKQA